MKTGSPPKFDHARRLAAALAYVGLSGLERVRLVAVDGGVRAHLEAGRGPSRISVSSIFCGAFSRPVGPTWCAGSNSSCRTPRRRA